MYASRNGSWTVIRLASLVLLSMSFADSNANAQSSPYDDIAVSFAVVDNLQENGFRFLITLEHQGDQPLPPAGWELYFNMMRMLDTARVPAAVRVEHINGGFYRITPTAEFTALEPRGRLVLPLDGDAMAIKYSDAPRGFYFVVNDERIPLGEVDVAPFVHDAQTLRSAEDHLPVPTPASRYESDAVLSVLDRDALTPITPTPVGYEPLDGTWTLDARAVVQHEAGLQREARFLVDALEPAIGARLRSEEGRGHTGGVTLRVDDDLDAESYTLAVEPERGVEIVGGDAAGVFYGIQSLRALLPVAVYHTPQPRIDLRAVRVQDEPGLGYRGVMLDVSRNFQSAESVRRLLDVMSFYKLNHFHFHVTDDDGWRLEIDGLPELTDVGGRRGHTRDEREHLIPSYGSGPFPDQAPGSGFYTRDEYIDLLRYAAERHITVIPEIDVPGHSRAAIVAMEARYHNLSEQGDEQAAAEFRLRDPRGTSTYRSVQRWNDNVVNVCQESTYRFIERVADDLIAMHDEAGVPLEVIHIGGDEVPAGVWQDSPACEALIADSPDIDASPRLFDHFLERTADILDERDIRLAGWEEIALTERFYGEGEKEPNAAYVERRFLPYAWRAIWGRGAEDLGYRLANSGYEIVLSNASSLYFDLAYDKHPEEPGFYWAGLIGTRTAWEFVPFDLFRTARLDIMGNPIDETAYTDAARLTAEGRRNVLGIQGQLWGETLVEPSRMEYMAFPRLLGLAERAWRPEPAWALIDDRPQREEALVVTWNEFANRLGQRELPRLDHLHGGIGYRIPVPGGVIDDGVLHANVSYPGMAIHYTTDGGVPTLDSPRYEGPVEVDGPVTLRVFDTRGRGGRTVTLPAAHATRAASR